MVRVTLEDGAGADLQFNVSQLLREGAGAIRRHKIAVPTLELGDGLVLTSLAGTVRFMRTGRGILVTGNLEGDVRLPCSRCLELFVAHVVFDLEEEFIPTVQVTSGERIDISEEDKEAPTIDAEHTLDLSDVIRQAALLALPMQPLCRPECTGLCPQCGANLNEVQCGCEPSTLDARWAKLGELFGENDFTERSEG